MATKRQPSSSKLFVDSNLPQSSKPLRLEYRDPKTLKANEKNWRTHPKRQRQAYQALKAKVGWAGAALYNETTKRLIDGHMRVDEAIKNNEPTVPVLVGSWTEEQENLLLAQLDPIGALATINKDALASLTKANARKLTNLTDENVRKIAQLNQDLEQLTEEEELPEYLPKSRPVEPKSETEEVLGDDINAHAPIDSFDLAYEPPEDKEEVEEVVFKVGVKFPSSDERLLKLPIQIPDLLPELIATPDMIPIQVFNRSKKQDTTNPKTYYCISSVPFPSDRQGGVLGFFTEDYRFNYTYQFPDKFLKELIDEDWMAVCSPDFSTYDDDPLPEKLWAVYRSRWCARYWQEQGIYVVPSIQYFFVNNFNYTCDISIATLPEPCPTIAFQVRSLTGFDDLGKIIDYAVKHKGVESVLIYGGSEKKKYIHGHIKNDIHIEYLPSFITERRKIMKEES
jgi:hypothetical protein